LLARRARAVDQDVADGAFKAARAVAVVDREARPPVDHVQRRVGARVDEEVGGEDQHSLVAGDSGLPGRGVGPIGGPISGQGGRRGGGQQQCGGRQQGALGVHLSSPSVSAEVWTGRVTISSYKLDRWIKSRTALRGFHYSQQSGMNITLKCIAALLP